MVYANIRQPAQIVVIDCEHQAVERTLAIPCDGPHGLCHDRDTLFCAADAGELIVLERDSGEVLKTLPLAGVPDVVMHDSDIRRLYVAVGEPGVVYCFDSDALEPLETVATEKGAHAIGLDPVDHCLYAFCPDSSGAALFEETS